ncbi:ATP-binding protein [Nocardia jinanensis]|uniref:LuxR family transcriptional regulator n=1 Tax=Nocardia jinanensis TaxID=382504 RepID=A0A917RLL9_9NOCA|nr:LuxR C-terminal-related transcriptional regulator [Nocardia jinanensis]GGL13634.1 LuxR family transcriptional regulator [Nocardia jinanensis]
MGAPARSLGPSGELPADLTSFVGRRSERTRIKLLLSESRLTTLSGFGGVGKTRLAQRAGADLHRAFADGVVFVDLAAITDPTLLPDTVAAAFGFRTNASDSSADYLVDQLRTRNALIILDNCEHLVDACAQLADTLLRTGPAVHILATSREPLAIAGETVLPIAPLTVPPADTGQMTEYESVTLFVERARAAVPGFRITDHNRQDIAEICRRLDGIPLALELAAVRLRGLTPAQLATLLTDQFHLMNTGSRAGPDRQRTLRNCLEWSYRLCSPAERRLWARAAVFSGGFELDAVEAVCGDPDDPHVLETLLSLVEKSIVIGEEIDGRMRYRMLEVIRQYGTQVLRDEGGERAVRLRHRDFFAGLVDRSDREWSGADQRAWIARMRRDHANLQTALSLCAAEPDAEIGLRIAGGLRDHWINLGALSEGTYWIEQFLQSGPGSAKTRIFAMRTAAWTALIAGDTTRARAWIDDGLQADGGSAETVTAFDSLSSLYWIFTGDYERALTDGHEALEVARRSGNVYDVLADMTLIQIAHFCLGEMDQSLRWHAECRRCAQEVDDTWYMSYSYWFAGLALCTQGDVTAATAVLRRNLQPQLGTENTYGVTLGIEALSWVRATVDPRESAVLMGIASTRWRSIGVSVESVSLLAGRHTECGNRLQAELGAEGFTSLMAEGARLGLAQGAETALGRSPGEVPAQDRSAASTATSLTRREREVAQLVGRGMSNREIAHALVIAQRTAETHVERILTKLGFTSRTQIAAWLADQQQ